jgi:thiamine pyrophosphate-dependent acetolactate synthase large subunit-like protein/nitrite reductase/ring-hydroxylating ferredoxin subunit
MSAPTEPTAGLEWYRVADVGDLPDGRVRPVTVDRHTICLTRCGDAYGALDNRCPHQGGPLGEGSIENGLLRCPWHGYDYDPLTGQPPAGFSDAPAAHPVEVRAGGVWVALPKAMPHQRTVGDVVAETLCEWGVDTVFGMVGHSNLGFADALRRLEQAGRLTYVGIRHEGAAAFAASAYGKLTGRPAACLAIAGPGSTNLLTGLYDAKVDRAPVVAVSGQVASKVLGRGAFQDLDLSAAFSDVAVSSTVIQAGSDHAELASLAVKHALDARAVTHLVLPDEVQVQATDQPAGRPAGRLGSRRVSPDPAVVAEARDLIGVSGRPVIIVGYGAREAMDDVLALADVLGAPVLTTFKAKGQIPDRHPLAGGVLGRSGTPVASWLMNEADALLVFGASFSNHTGIATYKQVLQVDHDPASLGRFDAVTVPLLGDVGVTARLLAAEPVRPVAAVDQRADVAARWAIWRAEKARRLDEDRGRGVASAAVFDALNRHVPADAVIAVDVGNHAYSFGRYFEVDRQRILMSGYLGSIGFGFPAAMGAWAATRSKVVAITGDGGFGQYLAETTSAVAHRMDIVHVVLDNGELGKISKEQRAAEYDVWQTGLRNPDFAAYAELCGARGIRVGDASQLDAALAEAFATDGPVVVAVTCDVELV